MRRVDRAPGLVAEGDQVVDLDDQLAELAALRDEGKLRGIGLSHVTPAPLEGAAPGGPPALQTFRGLLRRNAEPALQLCAADGVAWVPFFPLGSAFVGSGPRFA